MKLIKLKCENCGATLEVNQELDKINCNFCGAEILIDDEATKLRRVEGVKLQSRQKNHEQDLKERLDNLEQDIKEKEIIEKATAKDRFKKSKFSKVLLVFFAIAVLMIFSISNVFAKILAILQAVFFISSWLMGMEIITEPKKGTGIILAIIGFVMIIPVCAVGGNTSTYEKYDKINWDYIILKDQLPKPESKKGYIYSNSDTRLSIDIKVKSEKEYRDYIEECKKVGFTKNAKNDTNSYEATNKEGYKLRLWYSDYSQEYSITLEAKE